MATKWAVGNGNYSAGATWNGGTVPEATDDVYADGKTVTIDINIIANSIRTEQRTGGTAGGGFTFTTDRTIVADVLAGTTTCLAIATNGVTLNLLSTLIKGGTASRAYAVSTRVATINSSGTIQGGSGGGAHGIYAASYGLTLNHTGNVIGGSGGNGISGQGAMTTTVTGNVTANEMEGIVGGITTVTGIITASIYASAIRAYSTASLFYKCYVAGIIINKAGIQAVNYPLIYISGETTIRFQDEDDNDVQLYTSGAFHPPLSKDLQTGVVVGMNYEVTGTCAVPPKASVALNVPTDDTVGELVAGGGATPAEIIAALTTDALGVAILASASSADVADILTAISEVTGTTPAEIISYLLTQPVGKRMEKCTIEKSTLGVKIM